MNADPAHGRRPQVHRKGQPVRDLRRTRHQDHPVQDNGTQPRQIQVKDNGLDVFHPNSGEVRNEGRDGIACWFVDTDYNEESSFVRHAYVLGANDPCKPLKTTLKAEIHRDAWKSLHCDTSFPLRRHASGRIAIKTIIHFGDEVMRVFRV